MVGLFGSLFPVSRQYLHFVKNLELSYARFLTLADRPLSLCLSLSVSLYLSLFVKNPLNLSNNVGDRVREPPQIFPRGGHAEDHPVHPRYCRGNQARYTQFSALYIRTVMRQLTPPSTT